MPNFSASRRSLCLTVALSVCGSFASAPVAAGQSITPVTGFHATSASDPFAKKDTLEVISTPVSVVGVSGVRATVQVGCYQPASLMSTAASFLGMSLGPSLGFKISLTGANLDIVTSSSVHTTPNLFGPPSRYSTQDRTVEVKLRFDQEDTVYDAPQATDTHHVEFSYYNLAHADAAHRLLIGLSARGENVNLLLNLDTLPLKLVVYGCNALVLDKQKAEAEAAAKKKQGEADKQRDEANRKAAEAAKLEADRRAAEKERQEAAAYLEKITVKGSPEEILAKLPQMFAAKAAELGDPSTSYAAQIAEIGKLLKACSDGSGATPGCNLPVRDFFSTLPDGSTPPFRHVWIGWSLHGGDMMLGPPTKAQPEYFILQAGVAQRVDGQAPFKDLSVLGLFRKQTVFRAYVPYAPPYTDKLGEAVHKLQGYSSAGSPGGSGASTRVQPSATMQPPANVRSDGSWIDPRTKLMWTTTNNPEDKVLVYAQQYCQTLRLGGFSDWRLPSTDQLKTLYDPAYSHSTPPLRGRILFPMRPADSIPAGTTWTVHINDAIHLDVPAVWSNAGTEPGTGRRASSFDFSNGKVTDLSPNYIANMRCLCVRGPS